MNGGILVHPIEFCSCRLFLGGRFVNRPYKNNKTLSLPVGAIIDRPQRCPLYLSATRQILIIVCRAGVYSRRNVIRSIFLLRTNKRSPINPIINGVSLPLIIMLLYTKPPVPKSVRAVACKTKTTRGSKEAIAGEKIKNKGISRNEMCACRDRRPRRSKRNESSICLFVQNYVRA